MKSCRIFTAREVKMDTPMSGTTPPVDDNQSTSVPARNTGSIADAGGSVPLVTDAVDAPAPPPSGVPAAPTPSDAANPVPPPSGVPPAPPADEPVAPSQPPVAPTNEPVVPPVNEPTVPPPPPSEPPVTEPTQPVSPPAPEKTVGGPAMSQTPGAVEDVPDVNMPQTDTNPTDNQQTSPVPPVSPDQGGPTTPTQ